jgi:Ca2+-binding RTX toxin-like protein
MRRSGLSGPKGIASRRREEKVIKRSLVPIMCAMVGVLAIPATAEAARGDRCRGALTTIFGTDGPDSFATGFVGTNESDGMFAFAGDDTILGGSGEDDICGAQGDDLIKGGEERAAGQDAFGDHVFGGSGEDRLRGETGLDFLYGGDGNDRISGGTGDDYLLGGDGADDLSGGGGVDTFYGRSGDDILRSAGGVKAEKLFGGRGIDTCIVDAADITGGCEIVQVT